MTAFDESLRLVPLAAAAGERRFGSAFGPEWWGMRGPHGGWLAALVLRAMEAAVADPGRAPRSLTVHFTAPSAQGPVELAVREERRGGRLSSVSARVEQEGVPIALALGAFSAGRAGTQEYRDLSLGAVAAPEDVPGRLPAIRGFTERFEYRPIDTRRPFEGGPEARTAGWMRMREATPVDAAALATFADAWMPAAFFRVEGPVFAPTIDLTIHFRAAPGAVDFGPEGWVFGQFTSRHSSEGFWEEDGVLFGPAGELVAQSRQLALLIDR